MHMWHHVTNHLIISTDKDSNSENRIKLRVRDNKWKGAAKEMKETGWRCIRRPEWGVLVLTSRLKYKTKLALKRSLNYTTSHEP
jgi:hypothetical protein